MRVKKLLGALALFVSPMLEAVPTPAVPTALPPEEQNPYWAGKDFWTRRHRAKLAEIAAGPGQYDCVFVGDSITHNWEGWSDPVDIDKVTRQYETGALKFPNGPGKRIWAEMQSRWRLLNLGIGGDCTQHVLWRLEHGELDGYKTRFVMLMIGANNYEKEDEVVVGIKACLDKIAEKHPESRILLSPIFPSREKASDPRRLWENRVNAAIRRFADGEKVIWVDFTARFLTADGSLTTETMPDLLHPLEPGYRLWREAIEPYLSGADAGRSRAPAEPIFKATFDSWNTAPDVAAEKGVLKEGIDPELQLRMCDDVRGTDVKGNSLSLTVPEYVAYPCGGNFRPDRGTVSLWVKPMNYTLADSRYFHPYFSVEASGFQFYVYKYHQTPEAITVYMNNGGKSYACRGPAKWKRESWHHVAVAWDPNMIALYLDGKEAAKKTFNPPAVLPRKGELKHAKITLGDPKPWSSLVKDRLTQFDDLMIYDRRLSAKDIFDLFASTRPDLAAQTQAPAAEEEQPPVLTYRTFPAENKLKVKIDLGAADLPSDRDIPVELTLTKKGGREPLVRRTVVFAMLDSEVDFLLGTLEDRTEYQIAATIPGVKKPSVAKLRIPDRTVPTVARDHETPSPWFPVKRLSATEFAVLDRTYTFGENLYPVRIVSRGEDVLIDAPTFLLNGRRVRWETPRVTSESGDVTEFSATGSCDDFVLRGRGELWFDGFYKAEIALEPKGGAAVIDSFDLVWSVPRATARYLLTPDWVPWRADGNFSGRFGVNRNDTSAVWLTGPVNGFCWWCASDANWVVDGKDNVSIRRNDASASVRVRIVAKPTKLQGVARYLTGVQGTPAKRPDPAWRDRWYFGIGGDWTTCNWSSFSGRKAADNMRHVTSLEPESPEAFDRFLATKKKEGQDVLVYSMPTHLSDLDDAWDWYYDAWSSLPGIRWGFKDATTGAQAKIMPCCASTAAGDWHVSRAERLFREHPLVKGIYYDISSCTRCDNVQHGHGGVDAFGKPFGTSKAMDLRDYFLRIAKLCRRNDRWLHVHAHNLYLPFVHSFADVCWPGEEQFHLYVDNPRYHYLEGIPAEKYESALSGAIRGMYVAFINQNARAKSQVPSVYEKDPEAFVGTNAVYATLMPSFIYDFRDLGGTFGVNEQVYGDLRQKLKPYRLSTADFHPYWQDPVATAADGIRTALYTWKDGEGIVPFLLVVGNFSRETKRLSLDVDWPKVGARPVRLRDIVTGRVFDATALADAELPSHLFLMLVPETDGSH